MSRRRFCRFRSAHFAFLAACAGCSEPPSPECRGAERCECYANGTCDDGLTCLSNHCVDTTPNESRDAALDASLDIADGSLTFDERDAAATLPTTGGRSTNFTGRSTFDPRTDAGIDTTNDDATSRPTGTTSGSPTNGESQATNTTRESSGTSTAATSNGTTQTNNTSSSSNSTSESNTSEATSTADTTSTASTISTATTTNTATSSTDTTGTTDVTTVTPEGFPALPERKVIALDELATNGYYAASCPSPLTHNDLCYSSIGCLQSPCEASFEWIGAAVSILGTTRSLQVRDVSGDGTVLLADWGQADQTRGVVLRWGASTLKRLTTENASFVTAINFDATAAAGTVEVCDEFSLCDYEGGRFGYNSWQTPPVSINIPDDIAYGLTIVAKDRPVDTLLSTIWSSGEPTLVSGVGLTSLSGDAKFAAGTFDATGQLLLFYDNGTKPVPSTGVYTYFSSPRVNADGSVVVSNAWGATTKTMPMVHWTTNRDMVAEGPVVIVQPTGNFIEVVPLGVDASGGVAVGVQRLTPPSAPEDTEAFYWDADQGLRSLRDELADRGLVLPNDIYLHDVYVAADHSTLMGKGLYGETPIVWRVRLAL